MSREIRVIKRSDVGRIAAQETLEPSRAKEATPTTLFQEQVDTARINLTNEKAKDLAVFGTEGRLGEILCRTS